MSWQTQIFAYCERGHDPSFWAEPINALTNGAFILAAVLAGRIWLGLPDRGERRVEAGLVAIVFSIGVGSFLFHTLATRWAALADVLPITIFMIGYLAYALRRFVGLPWIRVAIATLLFCAALPAAGLVTAGTAGSFFAGSASYLPALVVLLAVGLVLRLRRHEAAGSILAAAGVFALSLSLRTLDVPLCTWSTGWLSQPLGTHFAWHLLNALLLYILLSAALLHGARPGR